MTDHALCPPMQDQEPFQILATGYLEPPQGGLTNTSEWTHLASARFGPPRDTGGTPWAGTSYRYDLFQHAQRRWRGLRWTHGGGTGWWIEQDRTASGVHSLFDMIASLPDEARRWDYCHQIANALERTISATAAMEAERWRTAILERRLHVTRRRGQKSVTLLPTQQPTAGSPPTPL